MNNPKTIEYQIADKDSYLKQNYRGNLGFKVKKGDWTNKYIEFVDVNKFEEKENAYVFFCDIFRSFNKKDIRVKVRQHRKFFYIPTSEIVDIWNAGWPRAGILIESLIEVPWMLLELFKLFFDKKIAAEKIKTKVERVDMTLFRQEIQELIVTFLAELEMNGDVHEIYFSEIYKELKDMFKKQIDYHLEHSLKSPQYNGIIIKNAKVFSNFDNPLVLYILNSKGHFFLQEQ